MMLAENSSTVVGTDLYDRGYGESGHDFLNADRNAENVVANPQFNSAEGFVTSATQRARRKVALLLRLAFLEGANRASTIFAQTPPSRVWVFSERITFYPSGVEPKGSGTTAYAWFVWDKSAPAGTALKWFKPGYKAKYAPNTWRGCRADDSSQPLTLQDLTLADLPAHSLGPLIRLPGRP